MLIWNIYIDHMYCIAISRSKRCRATSQAVWITIASGLLLLRLLLLMLLLAIIGGIIKIGVAT